MKLVELLTDDALKKDIEQKARKDAELEYDEPYKEVTGSYQRQAVLSAANAVYALAFNVRKNRLERVA